MRLFLAGLLLAGLVGCGGDAGKKPPVTPPVKDKKVDDKVKEGTEKAKEGVDKAGEAAKEGVDKAKEAVDKATEK